MGFLDIIREIFQNICGWNQCFQNAVRSREGRRMPGQSKPSPELTAAAVGWRVHGSSLYSSVYGTYVWGMPNINMFLKTLMESPVETACSSPWEAVIRELVRLWTRAHRRPGTLPAGGDLQAVVIPPFSQTPKGQCGTVESMYEVRQRAELRGKKQPQNLGLFTLHELDAKAGAVRKMSGEQGASERYCRRCPHWYSIWDSLEQEWASLKSFLMILWGVVFLFFFSKSSYLLQRYPEILRNGMWNLGFASKYH